MDIKYGESLMLSIASYDDVIALRIGSCISESVFRPPAVIFGIDAPSLG